MNREKNPPVEPVNGTENLPAQPGLSRNPSTPTERSNPFIWVSWLSKLMAGEKQCQWASWFRSHYVWEKVPSGLDLAKWTADHAQLLRARKAALEAQGFFPTFSRSPAFCISYRNHNILGTLFEINMLSIFTMFLTILVANWLQVKPPTDKKFTILENLVSLPARRWRGSSPA